MTSSPRWPAGWLRWTAPPLDVAAALATGARAVGVATGSFGAADLVAAGAHAVLPDLTDASLVLAAVTGCP